MYVNHKIFVAALLTLYTYLDICDAQKTVRDSIKVLTRNSLAKLIESVCDKTVWNLVWALNEVPMRLNTCQVIRSHCLMRSSDHLITSWKYVMCLISQPSEKLETPFFRNSRTWYAEHITKITDHKCPKMMKINKKWINFW